MLTLQNDPDELRELILLNIEKGAIIPPKENIIYAEYTERDRREWIQFIQSFPKQYMEPYIQELAAHNARLSLKNQTSHLSISPQANTDPHQDTKNNPTSCQLGKKDPPYCPYEPFSQFTITSACHLFDIFLLEYEITAEKDRAEVAILCLWISGTLLFHILAKLYEPKANIPGIKQLCAIAENAVLDKIKESLHRRYLEILELNHGDTQEASMTIKKTAKIFKPSPSRIAKMETRLLFDIAYKIYFLTPLQFGHLILETCGISPEDFRNPKWRETTTSFLKKRLWSFIQFYASFTLRLSVFCSISSPVLGAAFVSVSRSRQSLSPWTEQLSHCTSLTWASIEPIVNAIKATSQAFQANSSANNLTPIDLHSLYVQLSEQRQFPPLDPNSISNSKPETKNRHTTSNSDLSTEFNFKTPLSGPDSDTIQNNAHDNDIFLSDSSESTPNTPSIRQKRPR